jgi:hypothetical protein
MHESDIALLERVTHATHIYGETTKKVLEKEQGH